MTAAATMHTTLTALSETHPRLSKRQIADILKAAGVQGVPGKGVPLWPAIRTLLQYEFAQGRDANAASLSADASFKNSRAALKRLEFATKRRAVINVDVLSDALSDIQGRLIESLAAIPGASRLLAEMADPNDVREFLKEQCRMVRLRMDMLIRDIEDGLGRRRDKGEELAARSDDTVSPTDRILAAFSHCEDMEQLRAFIDQETLGL